MKTKLFKELVEMGLPPETTRLILLAPRMVAVLRAFARENAQLWECLDAAEKILTELDETAHT